MSPTFRLRSMLDEGRWQLNGPAPADFATVSAFSLAELEIASWAKWRRCAAGHRWWDFLRRRTDFVWRGLGHRNQDVGQPVIFRQLHLTEVGRRKFCTWSVTWMRSATRR